MHTERFPRHAVLAGAILSALMLPPAGAQAATIIVDGATCTLANAISSANAGNSTGGCLSGSGGADTIVILVDTTLTGELPIVLSDIAFQGAGFPAPTITGDGSHRLFFIDLAPTTSVSFSNLTLAGGNATGGGATNGAGGGAGLGGAIFIYDGSVSMSGVTFSNNGAKGGNASGSTGFIGFNVGRGGDGGGGMFGSGGAGAFELGGHAGYNGNSGGLGGGGGGGGIATATFGVDGGLGGGASVGGSAGLGNHPPGVTTATAGGSGEFGGGGGGGGGGLGADASKPGGGGAFGGGGGGGAGTCQTYANCPPEQGNGGAGGFGGGGGVGGSNPAGTGANGGYGGFGGGGGMGGRGESGGAIGLGGFGGGDSLLNTGGGGGAGFGGAIFIRAGHLDLQNITFDTNNAAGGTGSGNPGIGKGAAVFAMHITGNPNVNNQSMPATLPVVTGCNNTFTNDTTADAGSTSRDNADTFGADIVGLTLASCTDRIFADGFGSP